MSTKNTIKQEPVKKVNKKPVQPKAKKLTLADAQEQLLAANAMIKSLNKSIHLLNEQIDQDRDIRHDLQGQILALQLQLSEERSKGFLKQLFGG